MVNRDDALPFVLEERTLWQTKEIEHNRSNIQQLYQHVADLDVIRERSKHIPDMLSEWNTFKGQLPENTIESLQEIAQLKKLVVGAIAAGGLSIIGHIVKLFI